MLAYIPYMDPMGNIILKYPQFSPEAFPCFSSPPWPHSPSGILVLSATASCQKPPVAAP